MLVILFTKNCFFYSLIFSLLWPPRFILWWQYFLCLMIGLNIFQVFLCSLQFLIFWHSLSSYCLFWCVCLRRRLCSGYDDLGCLSCLTNGGLWKPNRELMWRGLTGEHLRWSGDCSNRWQMAVSGDFLSEALSFRRAESNLPVTVSAGVDLR